ncbi:MAG: pyruvate, phosphate dikinase [Calditrichaeota bacterium]|nr:MAG: pyruvate, phosphate dikinase [Calditrichota bacterium]
MSEKYVYYFGTNKVEGNASMKNLLGGKGANLAEMTSLGIPVPAGFTISTEVCTYFYQNEKTYPSILESEIENALKEVEVEMKAKFGDSENPLLVSVRSGARVSMPGMMDTVLNLGLNDTTVKGLIKQTNDERFAYDSYRRFIQMFGNVVLGIESGKFEWALDNVKEDYGIENDSDLTSANLKLVVEEYKEIVLNETGQQFPQDPKDQLWKAIGAVFSSWNIPRAITYRRLNQIPEGWGTAVNICSMVYGNMGNTSGTGVCFSRNPSNGVKEFFGEYLINAQGEDVVAGIRTPQKINHSDSLEWAKDNNISEEIRKGKFISLEEEMPEVYKELLEIKDKLEDHYRDMQDMEFTIQKGKLWMLQTRTGKRTIASAVKIAVDLVNEKMITKEEAILRIDPNQLDNILHPALDPNVKIKVLTKGLPASPGAASGNVVFSAEDAVKETEAGHKVILVRIETSPEDIAGMDAAQGILTSRGGMTSHAAVVARGMGKCCVAGCGEIHISYPKQEFTVNGRTIRKGDFITLEGGKGLVIEGRVKTVDPEFSEEFKTLMSWVDQTRTMKVRTNAETPKDSDVARKFGAEGIGLCRTEHMFFGQERITAVRKMIVASSKEERQEALEEILPMQRQDFKEIFKVMNGLPVTIRTLDPPLHEFLPHGDLEISVVAEKIGIPKETLMAKVTSLQESNPMLGHRGCRLGIVYPEITAMQARAIFEAACECKHDGIDVLPEIMIPLVGHVNELKLQKSVVNSVANSVFQEMGTEVDYLVGTMIEIPRAALTADEIAKEAEFFSFGTNDLTQTTYGVSRDDISKFSFSYLEKKIWDYDPFQVLDQTGVGQLVKTACEKGRASRPEIKLGICGEHGGEPSSVEFCHRIGLAYVSCSPYRVPIARLAAAQAVLKEK